jgi:hypothetical protein
VNFQGLSVFEVSGGADDYDNLVVRVCGACKIVASGRRRIAAVEFSPAF